MYSKKKLCECYTTPDYFPRKVKGDSNFNPIKAANATAKRFKIKKNIIH